MTVSVPFENPSSRCHSTYSGVAALDSTNTAVTGHAASQTQRADPTRSWCIPTPPQYDFFRT